MKYLVTAVITITLVLNMTPAQAETAQQFLDERTKGEKFAYLYGALEMAMIINKQQGNPAKSACIRDWFANHAEEANKELIGALQQVKGQGFSASNIISILIDRHCDTEKTARAN